MSDDIITEKQTNDNNSAENSKISGAISKTIWQGCSDPRLNGHEFAEFWGRCFDVTEMKRRPKKRRVSETQKTKPKTVNAPTQGYSNTLRAISHCSTLDVESSNGNVSVPNSETSPRDDFRVQETGTVDELLKFFSDGYLRRGVQLYFSDLSDFETFNDDNFGKCPEVFDKLQGLRHFRHPEILNNPCGPFLGFDWGQCRYFGEWDRDLWGNYMPWFSEACRRHQELREPIIFQYSEDSEKWSFRCAGYGERSTLGFPSESDLPFVYVLELGGLKVYMVPPELHSNPSWPSVVLVMGAELFRDCVSLTAVEREALSFLAQFGFKEDKKLRKISRIDVQVTTDRYTVEDVRKAKRKDRTVCRARTFTDKQKAGRSNFGNPIYGTLYFGTRSSGTCMLRVYDKRAELEETEYKDRGRKFYYFYSCLGDEQLKANPWGTLTRFEFELHSKIFKQFEVNTFEDFERKMPSIMKYLTSEWFRIIEVEKGNNHSSRVKTAKIWEDISETFLSVADFFATQSGGAISVTRRTKEVKPYVNPNWPRTVKKGEEFLTRAVGNLALCLGLEDATHIDKRFLDLVVYPVLCRRLDKIREFVIKRGAGWARQQSFLLYDSRQYYKRRDD